MSNSSSHNRVLAAISKHAVQTPEKTALRDARQQVSYGVLAEQVNTLAHWLKTQGVTRLALWGENSIAWVIADLACWQADIPLVPLPRFFSAIQLAHVLESAGIEQVLCCGTLAAVGAVVREQQSPIAAICLHQLADYPENQAIKLPLGTQKITYTSGTTARPKGVCLSTEAITRVSEALAKRIYGGNSAVLDRHFCLMPLSTLLENIAGVYVPLLLGKEVVLLSGAEIGLSGSSQLLLPMLLNALHQQRPNSLIVLPQILHALVLAAESGHALVDSLNFVAVGGAPTPVTLLQRAHAVGLPVYEGYGLSECASVVALNAPGAVCMGSVGQVLDHVQVRITDGEIEVLGCGYLGYLGQNTSANTWLATGDLGVLDAQGYLHITGRAKNVIVTSFGRNIAPEWLESELALCVPIAQVMALGDGEAYCSAIVVPRPGFDASAVAAEIAKTNATLPDYARIKKFICRTQPFSQADQSLTDNGRLRREQIKSQHAEAIACLYQANTPSPIGAIYDVF